MMAATIVGVVIPAIMKWAYTLEYLVFGRTRFRMTSSAVGSVNLFAYLRRL